jgi:PIN domain nuclease of toxin-antitoxin system
MPYLLDTHTFHRDPFDRLIIAEALKEKMTVLTKDNLFKSYGVKTVWL